MIFLDLEDLLHIADRVLGEPAAVRDVGLLQATLARPQATAGGQDAYPTVHEKAAALLHSLSRNHSLVDGNKRLALGGTIAFYGMNGFRLKMTNAAAYDLVTGVLTSKNEDVQATARALKAAARPRRRSHLRSSPAEARSLEHHSRSRLSGPGVVGGRALPWRKAKPIIQEASGLRRI